MTVGFKQAHRAEQAAQRPSVGFLMEVLDQCFVGTGGIKRGIDGVVQRVFKPFQSKLAPNLSSGEPKALVAHNGKLNQISDDAVSTSGDKRLQGWPLDSIELPFFSTAGISSTS